MRGRLAEIVPGLYQSRHLDEGDTFRSLGVDVVVDLQGADEHCPLPGFASGKLYIKWPIPDGDVKDGPTVRSLANLIKRLLGEGKKVLVHCQAGLNRSGLVTARTLIAMGWEPKAAIEQVRTKRGPEMGLQPLFNEGFQRWLHWEAPGT